MRVRRFSAGLGALAVAVVGLSWASGPVSGANLPASAVVDTPVPLNLPVLADFDKDGRLDAVFRGVGLGVLRGQADGSFAPVASSATTNVTAAVGPVDMNGDGNLDLLVRVACASGVGVCFGYFPGDGALGFGAVVELIEAPYATYYPFQGAAVDADDDGIVDLAFFNGAGVSVALGEGGDAFAPPVAAVPAPSSGLSAHFDDVDGDGLLDLVIGEIDSSVTVVLHADLAAVVAGGPLVVHHTPGVACGRTCLLVDLTGDGRADLVAPDAANVLTVAVAAGGGSFSAPVSTGAVGGLISPSCIAGFVPEALSGDLRWRYGDFDGDGRKDVFFRSGNLCALPPSGVASMVHVLRYDGAGFVTDDIDIGTAAVRMPALAVPHDQNGDGVDELVQFSRSPSGALNTQPFPHLRTVFLTADDGDGIDDAVDGFWDGSAFVDESGVASRSFTDRHRGGTTAGAIGSSNGLTLAITDAADGGAGVHVTAGASGGPASVTMCIGAPTEFTVTVTAGDSFDVTCGSITISVVAGPVDIALANDGGTLSVTAGSRAKADVSPSGEPVVTVLLGTATITAPDGFTTTLTPAPERYLCRGRVGTVLGTAGTDKLRGTNGDDVIIAFGGDDKVEAGSGNDVICAGAGDDKIEAGDGNDDVDAGAGNDKIEGGGGNDLLIGGNGDDKIEGGGGIDVIVGGPGVDKCSGGGKGSPPAQTCE